MSKIHVLSREVAELIAAGEVVERPASVVKELLENAIDASASAVTVDIRHGGISYIRVTDNGSGVEPGDLPTAFLRHATSKVRLSDDLTAIGTLGFRGEALASIAAVSRVEMVSKQQDQALGARICFEGGEQTVYEEAGCADGTTIVVRDLFYNVPARLKFLKRDTAEAAQIGGIMDRIALSHPEISFKYIVDRKQRMHTPGDGKLLSAVYAVFGREFAEGMIPVDYGMNGISVNGLICGTRAGRPSRSMQHFFVNCRYVRSKLCAAALEEGYQGKMMVGKYPSCVLNIALPFDMVDVNVHPAKTEVRFVEERTVYDAVLFAVRAAVGKEDILKRAAASLEKKPLSDANLLSPFQEKETEQTVLKATLSETSNSVSALPTAVSSHRVASPSVSYPTQKKENAEPVEELSAFSYIKAENLVKRPELYEKLNEKKITFVPETTERIHASPQVTEPEQQETAVKEKDFMESYRMIGELFKTYVLFEGEDRLFLLDKHAAHERILYEKLKRSVKMDERQLLLAPIVVNVSAEEFVLLDENKELLASLGFSYEAFGERSFLIREVPLILANADQKALFLDIAGKLSANRKTVSATLYEELLHSMACRAAIKANDSTSVPELTALLHTVIENDEIRHCPHGRPVVIAFDKSELERRFGRIP